MNLPDQNHPVCERLNLEKKKRIKKIKVKKCVSVTDEVLRKKKKERERERERESFVERSGVWRKW